MSRFWQPHQSFGIGGVFAVRGKANLPSGFHILAASALILSLTQPKPERRRGSGSLGVPPS